MADDLVTWATIKAMEGDALLLRWLKGFKQELDLTINRYFERGTSRGWVGGLARCGSSLPPEDVLVNLRRVSSSLTQRSLENGLGWGSSRLE